MKENLYKKNFEKKQKLWVDIINYRTSWNIYPKILAKFRVQKEEKILDAGCGIGKLIKWLKDNEVYGVDFNEESVKMARKGGYKKVVLRDIENLKFKNKEFDIAFSIQVFQYLKDPERAFDEIVRVTKKNIIITTPNFKWIRIKSFFGGKYKKQYDYCVKYENLIDTEFLKKLANKHNAEIKIIYLSNKYGFLRNFFGRFFSSEIMGIYKLK